MKKIFNLITVLIIACNIGNAQNINSITETSPIQCNGQTTTLTVITDAITSWPNLSYNIYVNVFNWPSTNPILQNLNPIQLTGSTFQTQAVQPDEYMIELINNTTGLPIFTMWISNMTIINPFVLHSTPSTSQDISCNGANDGTITTYLTGGTPPYTLNWTGPMTFSDNGVNWASYATSLLPGVYNCSLLDANNCIFQDPAISVQITEPLVLNADANTTFTAVDCNGNSTGTATVNPTGGSGTGTYTYLWAPTGQTTQTAINLAAGTHTCTVTDANNCTDIATVTVTEPPLPLTVIITPSNNNGFTISCLGGNDGTATAVASGGTIGTGYSYSWATFPGGINVATTSAVSGLSAGDYTCTVTDANGCSISDPLTVTEPPTSVTPFSSVISNWNGEDISCNGGSDGEATANGSGGVPYVAPSSPYTYLWTPTGQITSVATGLSAGTYNCVVTDANGCSSIPTQVIVGEPTAINILSTSSTDVDCNGNFTGSATVTPTQGTPPYSFQWDDSGLQQTQTATLLAAGTYNCMVSDINSCTYSNNPVAVTVYEPDPLTAIVSGMDNVSCTGYSDAWATITVSGGDPASYTYLWSSGHTGPTATGLSETTTSGIPYTCTVSDINGCVLTPNPSIAVWITEPATLPSLVLTPTIVSCKGGNDGIINAVGSGGTAPYTYVWQDINNAAIGTGPTITGLAQGIYTCILTDFNGCVFSLSTTVPEPANATTISHTIVAVSCTGAGDGGATVTPAGGNGPYSYSWSGPDPNVTSNTTNSISAVIAGTYICTITDNNGCPVTEIINIIDPPLLTITNFTSVDPSCFLYSTGSATVNVTGGTGAYTYLWTPTGQTTPTAGALTDGVYSCTVTDANGCQATSSVTLTEPFPINVTPLPTNVSCFGSNDGSISLTINGGTPNPSGNPYLYQWNNGTTTSTNSSLTAGSYSCTVTDANGCVATTGVINITEPASALGVTVTVLNDESCAGADDGSVQAFPTGGTLNYSYLWNNTAASQITSGLSAGLYTVVVTDGLNCTATASGTVNAASSLVVNSSFNSPSCNSTTLGTTNDGTASVTVTGGTGNYFYSWTDVNFNVISTASSASSLIAGTYNCAILDGNNCSIGEQVVVPEPSPNITATFNATNIDCFGDATGALTIIANGGTPSLTYSWSSPGNSNFSTTPTIQNLTAGTYTCNVSDATGCITPFTHTITESAVLSASLNTVQMSAQGANDASISVTNVTGGDGNYSYSWEGPSGPIANTTASINMLPWGQYTLTITDGLWCELSLSGPALYIDNPACGIVISDNVGVINCNDPNIVETAVVWWSNSGGVPPYTNDLVDPNGVTISNSWPTNQFQSNQTSVPPLTLAAGIHILTVTDAVGCSQPMNIQVIEPPVIQITSLLTTDALCYGGFTGTASATAIGGTGGLTISYVPQNSPTTPINPNALAAGTYIVIITDANGCVEQQTFTINEPTAPLTVSSSSTLVGCMPTNDGTATVNPAGGTPPYNFLWGAGQVTPQISTLSAGIYNCVVTDANGCPTTPLPNTSVIVSNAPALNLTLTVTNPTCNGGNDGVLSTSVVSGTLPISYNWQDVTNPQVNISTNPSVSGLSDGVYSLLAVDNYGCAFFNSAIPLISPAALTFGLSSTDPSLNGASDGTVSCSPLPSGGTAPYTYLWLGTNFSATTSSISSLPSGTYTLIVTDASGCQSTNVVNLIDPACNVSSTLNLTQPLCYGNLASLSWNTVGGFGGYITTVIELNTMVTYVLTAVNPSSTPLPSGDYYLQSQDNGGTGCLSPAYTFSVIEPLPLAATYTTTPALCAPLQGPNCTGIIDITVVGGTPNYTTAITDINGNAMSSTTLCPGGYVLTVTDFNGCTTLPNTPIPFTISSPAPISIPTITPTMVSCYNGNDGIAMATITGGTPYQVGDPYTYAWAPSGDITNPTLLGLSAGINTVIVTDSNGCIEQSAVTVPQPNQLAIAFLPNNPTCFSFTDGNIAATASGGIPPYAYLWNDPSQQNTSTANGLGAGTYVCTVTDAKGCTFTSSQTLTEPGQITAGLTFADVSCNGLTDGSATVNPTPSSSTVTWWDPSITTNNATNLIPQTGFYWVVISDPITGCTSGPVPFDILEPAVLGLFSAPVVVSPTCNTFNSVPGADGSITAIGSGGTAPYTYNFIDNSNSMLIASNSTGVASNLVAGSYTVEVDDGICPVFPTSVTVTGPAAIIANEVVTPVSCNGYADGSITINPTGENNNFSYLWSFTGSPTNISSGGVYPYLPAGPYSVLITPTDLITGLPTGCDAYTAVIQMTEPAVIDLTTNEVVAHALCNGDANGSIQLTPLGGVSGFSYLWSDGQVSSTAVNLSAGIYDCMVTDANGCIATTAPITITEPVLVTTGVIPFDISCNGVSPNDGYATVTPTGVSGSNFTVSWNGLSPSTTVNQPLVAGNYFVQVTNSLTGCLSAVDNFIINNPSLITANITPTSPTCFGGSNGSATITASGGSPFGNPMYNYQWEDVSAPGVIISTTATATALAAGNYTCKVYDTYNGVPNLACSIIVPITITEPAQILPGFSITDVSCTGLSDGSASVTPTGGTPFISGSPYQYNWSITGSTISTSSGYSVSPTPNSYTVTITDANGCSEVYPVLISEPNPISLSPLPTPATCFGYSDGSATMGVNGGSGGYSFVWSTGGLTPTISGLPAGTYACLVTDANLCPATGTVIVTEPTQVMANLTTINVSCNGANDGSVSVNPSGGNGAPYSVIWSNDPSFLFTLTAQNTIVSATAEVTDQDGCPTTPQLTTFDISENSTLSNTTNIVNPWCNGDANGSALVTVSGGTGTYTYSWEDDLVPGVIISTASMATGLVAGSYTCDYNDGNGCPGTVTVVIVDPPVLDAGLINTPISCFGNNDGILSVSPSGSTGPYTVNWSTGATGNSISGLSPFPAVYAVSVSDAIGCPMLNISGIYINEPLTLGLTVVELSPVSCNGGFDGQANITSVIGGTAPFTYHWPGGTINNTSIMSNYLAAGSYSVTVTDANTCTGTASFTITEPLIIDPNINTSNFGGFDIDCYGGSTGTITANPIGGNGSLPTDYTYSWSTTETTQGIVGLDANTYSVTVTDANFCTGTQYITLTEPPAINFSFATSDYNGYNISCCGLADGDIMATLTGGANGVDPASYSWTGTSSPSNSPYISSLYAGTYTLNVSDNNGCPFSQSITLTEPNCLSASATSGMTTCNNSNDGVASVSVGFNTGVGPYTYSWNDMFNQPTATTGNNLQGATSGVTYTVTVTDANLCTATANSTIFSPPLITTTANTTNISCFGADDGSLSGLSSTGGAPGGVVYTYSFDGITYMPALPSYNNLTPGPIDVYAQDMAGCIDMTTFTIIEPSDINPDLSQNLLASCIGVSDGAVISNSTGGAGGYTYLWYDNLGNAIPGATTATGLSVGEYNIVVTDLDGCIGLDTFNLLPAFTLTTILTQTPVFCTGGSTGSVDALLIGSGAVNAPLPTYTWTDAVGSVLSPPLNTSSSLGGLSAGTYTCLIQDNLGCSVTESVVVVEPPTNLNISVLSTNLSCFNINNGTADLTVQGGAGAYSYQWHTVPATSVLSTTISVSGLSAGDYQAIVTDGAGCIQAQTFTVTQPDSLYSTITSTNVSCFAAADGIININTYNGTQPYSFEWVGPNGYLASTSNISNLDAGLYTLTVTDYNNCKFVDIVTITQPPVLVGVSSTVNPSCYNSSDGSIEIIISGGVSPYYADYGNGSFPFTANPPINDNILFSNLPAGNLPLIVIDDNGCELNVSFPPLINPLELVITSTLIDDPICYGDSGDVTINSIGGVLPYSYEFIDANGLTLNLSSATNSLVAGDYDFTLIDANGCMVLENITLTEPNEILIIPDLAHVDCFGSTTGSISVVVEDAVGTPAYSWVNDNLAVISTTEIAANLAEGIYVVHVYDDNGCYQTDSYTIIENNEIVIDFSTTDALCSNSSDGSIEIYSITGGIGPYDVYIDNVLFSSSTYNTIIGSLLADSYTVQVSDVIGCLDTMEVEIGVIGSNDCITASIIVTPDGSYGTNDYWSPGLDLGLDDIQVTILNRWGQEVWNCLSLSGGNDCRWTGQNNEGSLLPSTDYYYIIEYTNETQPAKTGVITLIR